MNSSIDENNESQSNNGAQNGSNEAAPGTPENDLENSGSDAVAPAEGATGADADAGSGAADGNLNGSGSGHINQEVTLDTIAQAESTRSFFLAQTLESTKTIPVVSAKLPIDTDANDAADTSAEDGASPFEGEGSDDSDGASGSDDPVDPSFTLGSSEGDSAAVAAESTVIGSFEYRGITYAVEPGGESVAVMAADYAKLPQDFIEAQTIVLPSVVSPDNVDYYSVIRIADDAFSSLTAAAAADNGRDAGASSDIQAQAEACAYGDQATSNPSIVSAVVDLNDGGDSQHVISSDTAEASDSQAIPTEGADASSTDVISSEGAEADPNPHVISSGVSEANGVEKSRPSSEDGSEASANSTEAESIGITAITIPASITTIEEDAFAGFDTLQYVIVSEDNQNYSMYDGCLYDKPLSSLLLIPEGRMGAVRVASQTSEARAETFSHHADLTLYVNADSAALTSENGFHNADSEPIDVQVIDEDEVKMGLSPNGGEFSYDADLDVEVGDTIDVLDLLELDQPEGVTVSAVTSQGTMSSANDLFMSEPGAVEAVVMTIEGETPVFYGLHVNVEGDAPVEAAAETELDLETANVAFAGESAQADGFVHNRETCAAGGGELVPAEDGRYYGWTCPHYKDYAAPVYSSTPGTPGYTWVPDGITPSANISKQAVEAGEYYLIAGGKFANTGAVGSGGMFPASQVRNDYGKPASAWWEITASQPNASLGTLRIHCDYGTVITNTEGAINTVITIGTNSYSANPAAKTTTNAWRNTSDFPKIRDILFDHVDADSCAGWFSTHITLDAPVSNIETVTFVGNTAPPSTVSMESMFTGSTHLYSFSENFTMLGLRNLTDIRWMLFECGSFASFPLQFSQPSQVMDAWGWLEDCISIGSLPDSFCSTVGLTTSDSYMKGDHSMLYMFGLNNYSPRKLHGTIPPGDLLQNMNKLYNGTRVWYYAGNDAATLTYLRDGKGTIDHTVIRSKHVTWDARGGTFSHSVTSSPTGSSFSPFAYNCSYVEPIYQVNGSTVTNALKETIKVPQSPKKDGLHFLGWYEKVPVGTTDEQRAINEKNCVYRWEKVLDGYDDNNHTIANPGETKFYYALYGEDEFVSDIIFDTNTGQGGTHLPERIEDQTVNVAMREPQIDVSDLVKPGYIFDGFWSDKNGGKQYYDATGKAADETRWTETGEEVTLYAHWKYKVYLDLNTYNTDNELVLNSNTSTQGTANTGAKLDLTENLLDTQTGLLSDDGDVIHEENVAVEGASGAQAVDTKRYYILASFGAPLQLPQAVDRTGYSATGAWGLTVPEVGRRDGTASDLIAQQSDNCYLANDNKLAAEYAKKLEGVTDYDAAAEAGVTLYADWSGRANTYWVQLQADYSTDKAPADTFTTSANGTQYVQVTYDQPVPVASVQKPVGNTTATNAVTGVTEPRNLRFAGFRTQPNSLKTGDGKEYVAVKDGSFSASIVNGVSVKFRETNDGKTGAITTTATPPGESAQTVIVLYGKWLNPEVNVTIDLQGGTINGSATDPIIKVEANAPIPGMSGSFAAYQTVPVRKGYKFTGYWTSRYTETEGAIETIDGNKVEAKRYYEPITQAGRSIVSAVRNPDNTSYNRDWTSYKTEDKLYAHWEYKIYLNLNTVNTDGETVLNAAHTMADGSGGWTAQVGPFFKDEAFATEQKGRMTQPDNSAGATVRVQGADEQATLRTDRYYYTTIAGAPIGLPQVTGRIGYADTRGWGTAAASFGGATNVITNVDAATGIAPDDSIITAAYDEMCAADVNADYDKGITLFANWRGVDPAKDAEHYDKLSGYPRTYTVELWSAYTHSITQDIFAVTDPDTMNKQQVAVTYDAPIDYSSLVMPKDASVDKTTLAPRNLDLRGFFTRECTVEPDGSVGKSYLNVTKGTDEPAFSVESGSAPSKKIMFRETTDDVVLNDAGEWASNTGAIVENNAVILYAWWTYSTSGIVFDLQGGELAAGVDPSKFAIDEARSHGDVPRIKDATGLGVAYEAEPTRAGYRFAGYWNTPYREQGIDTDEHNANLVPDADTPARCYYVWDEAQGAVVPNPDMPEWLEYQETRLYAHWEYDIHFDKNLTYADIATIDYTAVDEGDPDEAGVTRVSASVPLARSSEMTDAYGNTIVVVGDDATSDDENAERTVTIRAIAGAPVLLPLAHTRLAYDNDDATKTYNIKTGYHPTREFYTQKNGDVLSNHVSYVASESQNYTTATDSWGEDGLPCALGKTSEPTNERLDLHAKWTPMEFYVQLMSDYDADDAALGLAEPVEYDDSGYTATENPVVKVTYDARLDSAVFPSDYAGPIRRFSDYRGSGARALVGASPAEGEEDAREHHENLDFYGFWTEQNDFRDNSQASARGTMYLNGDGESNGSALNGTSCKQNFRFLTADVAATELAENSKERPYRLYALWGEPTRGVTFNYFDEDATADSTTSDTTDAGMVQPVFTLQKGDVLADEVSALSTELATVAANVTGASRLESRANYRFAGFWTTTYREDAPELIDGVEVEPVRYFDLNEARTALVATHEKWDEDEPTTLYAHWKYRIQFEVDGQSPDGTDDLLAIGTMARDDAAPAVAFSDEAFTDDDGYVVFGQPLTLPFDNDTPETAGKLNVKRLRDHGGAGVQETGYAFRAWLKTSGDDDSAVPVFADDADVPKTFAPDAGNVVHLYGAWTADTYTIQLLNTYEGFAYNGQNVTVNERGTVSLPVDAAATVEFDEPLTERITPPSLYGYEFKGYFTGKNGVNADGSTTPYYGPGDPALGGLSAPSTQPWCEYSGEYTVDRTQKIGYLYAWYDRIGYEVRFATRDMGDGTLQTVTGSASPEKATWHYGDDLTATSVFPEPNFTRAGYKFDGWYYYEDDLDGTGAVDHADKSKRTYVYRYDAEGAEGAGLGGVYATEDGESWTYRGGTWPNEYGMTLYAGWTPNEYALTFYSNYPHKQTAADTLRVTYEQVIDFATDPSTITGNPLFEGALLESGAPYEFVGWNTNSAATETTSGGWLLGYDSLTETHRMALDDDGALRGGRFMPQGTSASASGFTYYAIWEKPDDKTIHLFPGAHGDFASVLDAGQGFHLIDDFSFDYGSSFASSALIPRNDSGWTFKGYMLVPSDEVPEDGVITAEVAGRINGKERGEGNRTWAGAFPKPGTKPDPLNNYLDAFEDYYLVGTWALEGDYSVTLDLGAPSTYEGAAVSVEGDVFGTLPSATDPHTLYRYGFKTEQPIYSGDGLSIIGYEKTPAFHLPTATEASAKGHVLTGWYLKQPGDPDDLDYAAAGRPKVAPGFELSPATIAADAQDKGASADLVYVAAWSEESFTIVFDTMRYQNAYGADGDIEFSADKVPVMATNASGDRIALENEAETWADVPYTSKITLPYPATRGGGMAFETWSLSDDVRGQHTTYGGSFAPATEVSVKQLVEDVRAGRYRDVTIGEDNTITFYGHWYETMSVTMPIQALVALDPESGDVLAAPAYVGSRWNDSLEVVSLRYDQMKTDFSTAEGDAAASDERAVFGLAPNETAAGKAAYLTVYAGLEANVDAQGNEAISMSELLRSEHVGERGALDESAKASLKTYNDPLLIDLNGEASQVFPKTDPLASGSDGIQTLRASGFREFGYWESDAGPILYGLWFDGAWTDGSGNPITPGAFFREMKGTLPATTDSGASYPIAQLFYTVAKA